MDEWNLLAVCSEDLDQKYVLFCFVFMPEMISWESCYFEDHDDQTQIAIYNYSALYLFILIFLYKLNGLYCTYSRTVRY